MQESHECELLASAALEKLLEMARELDGQRAEEAAESLGEFGVRLRELSMGLEREFWRMKLQLMDEDAEGIVINGVRFRRVRGKFKKEYETPAGGVSVQRSVYRPRGGHGGKMAVPLEMRTGMVGGRWVPRAAQIASSFVGAKSVREARGLLKLTGTMGPSVASLDRVTKLVGEKLEGEVYFWGIDDSEILRCDPFRTLEEVEMS